jgi:hypothetical protein
MTEARRLALSVVFALAGGLAAPEPARAQGAAAVPSPAPAETAPTSTGLATPTDDFGPDLKAWLEAVKISNKEAADAAFRAIQRKRAERAIENLEDVAAAIRGRAEALLREGRAQEAADAARLAALLTPDSPASAFGIAKLGGSLGDARAALGSAEAHPFASAEVGAALRAGVLGGLFLVAWGFGVGLLLRYGSVLAHDVMESLPESLKPASLFLAALFLALPLAGLMGWGFLPFWWMAVLFIFQVPAERIASGVLLALLAAVGAAFPGMEAPRRLVGAVAAERLLDIARGGVNGEGVAAIAGRAAAAPEDADLRLLKANLLRRGGRPAEALAALTEGGGDPRFAHNAAAFSLLSGAAPEAIAGFQGAVAAGPPRDRAIANYNLSLAMKNSLRLDEGNAARRAGDAIDADLLARFDRIFTYDRDGANVPAPPEISPALAIPELRPASLGARDLLNRLSAFALVVTALILVLMSWRGNRSFSKQCEKCGQTFCWLCQVRSTSVEVCSQCFHLFVVRKGISAQARTAKNAEIERFNLYKGLLHRVFGLIAPGSSHVAAGHWALGLPLLLVWGLAAGVAGMQRTVAPPVLAEGPLGSTLFNGAVALIGLAVVLAQAIKPKPPVIVRPRRERGEEAAA